MKEKNKGITLIALVITIIVLLILAAISIATLTGNNGILTRANEAKEQTIVGKEKEEISTAYNGAVANNLEPKVTAEDLQGELDKLVGEGKTNVEEIEDGKLKVTFDTNHSYEVSNGQTTQVEDTEFTPSVDWSKILDEANKNPDSVKHKDQLESDLIGIGTDGNPVNMDYWKNIYMANDGTFGIGVKSGHGAYAYEKSYVGGVTSDGKIQGTIPQYIYNAATKKFVEITELPGTFLRNEEIRIAPQIPSTVVFMGHTFYCCTNLEKGSEIPSGVGTVENDLNDKEDSFNSLKKDLSTLSIPEGYLNYYNNLNDIFSLYSSYLNSIRTAIIYERSSSGYEKNKNVIDKNYDTAYEKYNNVLDNIHEFLSLLENS